MTPAERKQRRAEILIRITHEAAKRKEMDVGMSQDLCDKYFLLSEIDLRDEALRILDDHHDCGCDKCLRAMGKLDAI